MKHRIENDFGCSEDLRYAGTLVLSRSFKAIKSPLKIALTKHIMVFITKTK